MKISLAQARFTKSAAALQDFPIESRAEIAFCGRSNAGKSSAINALCRQGNLARTSKTPGRTQLINFFKLQSDSHLVDLPGYGYAKAAAKVRKQWQRLVENYLVNRGPLCGLVLVMDIRNPLTEIDWTMIRWTEHYKRPLYFLLTKVDKLNKTNTAKTLSKVTSDLEQQGFNSGIQVFSATKKIGITQAEEKISTWLSQAIEKAT